VEESPLALTRSSALAEPMLSPEAEARLIQAWKNDRDEDARRAIVRAYARLCYHMAAKYSSNPDHVDDLAQEGSFGIMRAMDKFDPSRGVKFSTYSRYWVQNFVAAAAAATIGVISVPSRAYIDAKMGRLPPGKNDAAVLASQPLASLDAAVGDGDGGSVLDNVACPRPNPEDEAAEGSQQEHFRAAILKAMATLTERERTVIGERKLADPPKTLEEIAAGFGVTRERVRQIEVSATSKLHDALVRNGFDPSLHFRD